MECSRRCTFAFDLGVEDFLSSRSTLREITVRSPVNKRKKGEPAYCDTTLKIPLLYVQLIGQLVAEDEHASKNRSIEALRRRSYARRVLDKVGEELSGRSEDGFRFRSTVLNPILQRYLRGVPDSYTPSIRAAISGDEEPTIRDVTAFYLARDPIDIDNVETYIRNLLYIPESRWYYGVLRGNAPLKDIGHFNKIRANHDKLMGGLAENDEPTTKSDEVARLTELEVEVIYDEQLEDLFAKMLENYQVHTLYPPIHRP